MNRGELIIACAIVFACAGDVQAKLPPSVQVCSRNSRNLADCIISSVKRLQPSLVHGNLGPGFQIPPLEPFSLDNVNIGRGNDFKAVFTNLVIRGPSRFRIDKMRANLNELKFDFIITFPNLDIRGKYDLIFRLFGFSLKGRGDIIANFQNTRARVSMKARKYLKNGEAFLNFEKFYIKIQPGQQRNIKLTNLFQGNPGLEEIGNAFINGNSEFFLTDVYPSLENSLADLFTNIANRITGDASFDELFPNI